MKRVAIILAVAASVSSAFGAGQVTTRAAFDALVPTATFEDFETFAFGPAEQAKSLFTKSLDKDTTYLGQGPNLVKGGARYEALGGGDPAVGGNSVQWNNDGYFGLETKTLATLVSKTQISYDSLVKGMGIDLHQYVGFIGATGAPRDLEGKAEFYRGATLIGTVDFSIPEEDGNGFFLGWYDGSGISSVVLTATGDLEFTPAMDDHAFGGEVVPEPATMVALGAGALAFFRRRRKS